MSGSELAFACVSDRKGIPKHAVGKVHLVADHGIEGDAHAGGWHRQVSLLAASDIDGMRARGLDLKPGAFGENLVIRGLELGDLGVGSRIAVGDAALEITQIGKACHTRCAIYYHAGDCIMPRLGLFARVVRGAEVAAGAPVAVLEGVPRSALQAAVLTVSDRCAQGRMRDTAGPAVATRLREALAAHLAWSGVESDTHDAIVTRLKDLADRDLALVVTVGGTGLAERDVTPEATREVVDREVPGLAEAMRAASAAITPNAWLSRGICGVRRRTLIVNLPGSLKAATENLEVLLPVLPHAVRMLRGDTVHPDGDADREVQPTDPPEVCP